jgi:uncharacterized membrane protein
MEKILKKITLMTFVMGLGLVMIGGMSSFKGASSEARLDSIMLEIIILPISMPSAVKAVRKTPNIVELFIPKQNQHQFCQAMILAKMRSHLLPVTTHSANREWMHPINKIKTASASTGTRCLHNYHP